MAPKVLARHRRRMVNDLNEAFLLPCQRVAPCYVRRCQKHSETKILRRFSSNHRQRVRMATASPNILVVEDDRETRTLIAKYLRNNACNVTTANDGREMAGR